ncbi:protein of unknown function [Nitrosomonas sp. PY1]|uniref:YfiR family protein n=1 Tax=Nitrosomonas sp. PY1 TaxID=1803906 RepID=UPI001FC86D18|nr:YfiR family protein [Nitrosomonas sp. PY1]GKS69347.1 protein of unknown function [Nitrosomonas sp. PY1]
MLRQFRIIIRAIIFVLALVTINIAHVSISMASTTASEQSLIAAFLFNFLKFTEWPDGIVTEELKLCVTEDQVFKELDTISGRLIQSKRVIIQRVNFREFQSDCQLLYLSREENIDQIQQWLKITDHKPILIVSNANKFLDMGGMIILINNGKTLSFEIDLERIKYAGLKLNAQLLQIARDVRGR